MAGLSRELKIGAVTVDEVKKQRAEAEWFDSL